MSYNNKRARKRQRARAVTETRKGGGKIGRTQKLHRKTQIYPKQEYSGNRVRW